MINNSRNAKIPIFPNKEIPLSGIHLEDIKDLPSLILDPNINSRIEYGCNPLLTSQLKNYKPTAQDSDGNGNSPCKTYYKHSNITELGK